MKIKYSLLGLLVIVLVLSLTSFAAERLTAYVSMDEEVARSLINAFEKEMTALKEPYLEMERGPEMWISSLLR